MKLSTSYIANEREGEKNLHLGVTSKGLSLMWGVEYRIKDYDLLINSIEHQSSDAPVKNVFLYLTINTGTGYSSSVSTPLYK